MQLAKQPVEPCSYKKTAPVGAADDRTMGPGCKCTVGTQLWIGTLDAESDQAQPFWDMDST